MNISRELTRDIVSIDREDEPLIYISERAINLKKENDKLHHRINKAIEYIENQNPSDIEICGNEKKYYYTLGEDNIDRLLEILKVSDKE